MFQTAQQNVCSFQEREFHLLKVLGFSWLTNKDLCLYRLEGDAFKQ
jgi:hypothetical protein